LQAAVPAYARARPRASRLESLGISPYLKGLREHIGHELVLLPAVAVLPWDDAGRLLMVRELQTGLWQVVDGVPRPDGEETLDAQWFSVPAMSEIPLTDFTVTLLSDPTVAVLGGG
jgi:hypothetical protein